MALKLAIINNRKLNLDLLAFSSSSESNNNKFLVNINYDTSLQDKEKKKNYPKNRKRANSQSNLILTDYLKEALIGLTLGDISLEKATKISHVRLRFDQGLIHSNYLYFLYDIFKTYTLSPPKTTNRKPDKRTGKIYNSLNF